MCSARGGDYGNDDDDDEDGGMLVMNFVSNSDDKSPQFAPGWMNCLTSLRMHLHARIRTTVRTCRGNMENNT